MRNDVYYRLGERLNENQVKLPLVDPFLEILREYYTEEQAAAGAGFPLGSHTLGSLAKSMGRDEEALREILESMADEGLAFTLRNEDGQLEYSLTPFFPGAWEFQLMRGTHTPRDRKLAKMTHEFLNGLQDMIAETMKTPELFKELMPDSVARTVTIEEELPSETEIFPFERLTELVDRFDSFSAAVCYCRHHAHLVGNPCKVDGIPEHSCLAFGPTADYVTERKFGKKITKQECLSILKASAKAGLVHNTNNYLGDIVFVCNCCGCCCGMLDLLKRVKATTTLTYSNFQVSVGRDSCTGCGDCVERCPMDALSLADEIAAVDPVLCLGCGTCITVCPTQSLSMVRRAKAIPPEDNREFPGMGV
jgi:Pyruvate/2-oxoacid:ferredoxin oxidoreductase delta subunit